jgi:hypothetical protein
MNTILVDQKRTNKEMQVKGYNKGIQAENKNKKFMIVAATA